MRPERCGTVIVGDIYCGHGRVDHHLERIGGSPRRLYKNACAFCACCRWKRLRVRPAKKARDAKR